MNAKDLLLQYENNGLREKRLKDFISSQRKLIRSLDLNPCRLTRQMKKDLSFVETRLRLYEEEIIRVTEERQKIFDLVSNIPGEEGTVLKLRYIDGKIWEDISDSMFYSTTHTHKLHRRGLQIVQDRLDQDEDLRQLVDS